MTLIRSLALFFASTAVLAFAVPLPSRAAANPKLLLLGDSFASGYQLQPGEGLAHQLQVALDATGIALEVIDGSQDGATSTAAAGRLFKLLTTTEIDYVLVELGPDDPAGGVRAQDTLHNLDVILRRAEECDVQAILAGFVFHDPVELPNLEPDWNTRLSAGYGEIAKRRHVALYPDFLKPLRDPRLMLPDGIHPNADGVRALAERLAPAILDAIARANDPRSSATRGLLSNFCAARQNAPAPARAPTPPHPPPRSTKQ